MADPQTPSSAADRVCMRCALCCDGTLFGSVVVADAERERLGRVGLRVVQTDRGATLEQPCSALRGTHCGVYAERPSACARYACLLRRGVEARLIGEDDALAKVARMHALVATLREAFEAPAGSSLWARIMALEEPEGADAAREAAARYADAIAAVGELLELARRSFEPKFSGGATAIP
jgi:hypothetical protein